MKKSLFILLTPFLLAGLCFSNLLAEEETLVNTYVPYYQMNPSIAMNCDGNFAVVWMSENQDGSNYGIYAQRFNAEGTPVGDEHIVNTYTSNNQSYPDIAMSDDGYYVVTWHSKYQDGSLYGIYAQRYDSNGNPLGDEFKVNTYTNGNQKYPSVAMADNGDFVIAWHGKGSGDGSGIFARMYDGNGDPIGDQFLVNNITGNGQYHSDVAMDGDGNFVIAWHGYGNGDSSGIYARIFTSDGTPQGNQFLVNTYKSSTQRYPSVAMDEDGNFIVTWESYGQDGSKYGIYAQRFFGDGSKNGAEFKVNTYTNNTQKNSSVAMSDDGYFVVTWQSYQGSTNYDIKAQKYFSDGTPDGGEFSVNSYKNNEQSKPSVAMSCDGDFAIAWNSKYQTSSSEGNSSKDDGDPTCGDNYGFDVYCITYQNQTNNAIALEWISAEAEGDHVLITWKTGSEIDNLGFYIVRSEGDKKNYTLVNQEIIPARGSLYAGHTYRFVDYDVKPAHLYNYWLVDLDIFGQPTVHDPVRVITNLKGLDWVE